MVFVVFDSFWMWWRINCWPLSQTIALELFNNRYSKFLLRKENAIDGFHFVFSFAFIFPSFSSQFFHFLCCWLTCLAVCLAIFSDGAHMLHLCIWERKSKVYRQKCSKKKKITLITFTIRWFFFLFKDDLQNVQHTEINR